MKALRFLAWTLGAIVVAVAVLAFVARFHDGPLVEMLPGGPLTSGEWEPDGDVDFSFARDTEKIELETGGRSRWVWIVTEGHDAFVPASLSFPPLKRWHREALEDPEAVVRIDGRRYHRRVEKVEDPALHRRLVAAVRAKYANVPASGPDDVWFFRLAPAEVP